MSGRRAGTRPVRVGLVVLTGVLGLTAPARAETTPAPTQDSVTGTYHFNLGIDPVSNGPEGDVIAYDIASGPQGENPTGTVAVSSLEFNGFRYDVKCLRVTGNTAVVVGVGLPSPRGVGLGGNDTDPGVVKFEVVDNGAGFDPFSYKVVPADGYEPRPNPQPYAYERAITSETCETTADMPPLQTQPLPFVVGLKERYGPTSSDDPPMSSSFTVVDAQPARTPDSTPVPSDPGSTTPPSPPSDPGSTTPPSPPSGSGPTSRPSPMSKSDCKRGGYAHFGFSNQGRCIRAVKRARRQGRTTGAAPR